MGWFTKYPGTDYSQITLDVFMQKLQQIEKTVADLVARVIRLENQGGGGGTTDYDDLTDKPQINGNTLQGNKTASQLGLATPGDIIDSYNDLNNRPTINGVTVEGMGWSYTYKLQSEIDISTSSPGDVPVLNLDGDFEAKTLTAGDVGAIPAPATPSDGNVLTYDNNDSEWKAETPHYIPSGGTTGQVLKKTSATDYDAAWANESGGAERAWTLLQTVDIANDGGGNIVINNLDNYTDFYVYADGVKNGSTTDSGYLLNINNYDICQTFSFIGKSATSGVHQHSVAHYNGLFWECISLNNNINDNVYSKANAQMPYAFRLNVGKCTTFKLTAPLSTYQATAGTIYIYGR